MIPNLYHLDRRYLLNIKFLVLVDEVMSKYIVKRFSSPAQKRARQMGRTIDKNRALLKNPDTPEEVKIKARVENQDLRSKGGVSNKEYDKNKSIGGELSKERSKIDGYPSSGLPTVDKKTGQATLFSSKL